MRPRNCNDVSLGESRAACKPGSVSTLRRTVTIYLAPALPLGSSGQPGNGPDAHGSPIWPCSRWGLAAGASPHAAGRSYRPISPLPRLARSRRRYVSVPLSVPSARCASEPGSYPAPCPAEPGLSSPRPRSLAAATRPDRHSPYQSLTHTVDLRPGQQAPATPTDQPRNLPDAIIYANAPWCSGSTSAFGAVSPGSSPGGAASSIRRQCRRSRNMGIPPLGLREIRGSLSGLCRGSWRMAHRRPMVARMSLASIIAKPSPMQRRGPPPKGK